ncbi:MAG: T9SS type A sorting domain-containing protein [bacterium]|nr:T9SS type A sorting domain-containing protein [bacterium]
MKTKLTTLTVTICLALCLAPAVSLADYAGVVTVDSVTALPGESVGVPIWLRGNDVGISAMSIPLKFASPYVTVDSISLSSAVWGASFAGYSVIDNDQQTVSITILPIESISPLPEAVFVDGIVAEMFFSVSPAALPHSVSIDSIYEDTQVFGDVHDFTRIDISDNTGLGLYQPDYVPGQIEVRIATGINDGPGGLSLPAEFALDQNYPNPFNPTTVIGFGLPAASRVDLQVFNILGQNVKTLVDRPMEAGWHDVEFNGADLPSGIYFYRLRHDNGNLTRKMMLVK